MKLFTLMAMVALCQSANAQTAPEKEADTIRIGNIIITKNGNRTNDDKEERRHNTNISIGRSRHTKPSNVSTNWGIVDLGFANYSDETNYAAAGSYLYNRAGATPIGKSDFKLNTGKSVNVNIWFFMQRLNLIKQHVNLKYGLGLELNNYRYRSSANISYLEQNPYVNGQASSPVIIRDSIHFTKNKLAADYVTVPLMLNFSTSPGYTNKGLSLSVGVSAGYLYSQRNKQISEERGKQKNRGDYDLERFKLSYIAEVGLGPVRLYGSYSPKSFYSTGLDMKPYTFGIRLSNW
ncbi:MAG: outer membrane beta-barrel protein [Ferruginibacter sp.]